MIPTCLTPPDMKGYQKMKIIKLEDLQKRKQTQKYKQVKARIIANIDLNISKILPFYIADKLDTKDFKSKDIAKVRCFYPDKDENETIYKLRNATSVVLYLKDESTNPDDIKKTLEEIKGKIEKDEKDFETAIYDFISYKSAKSAEVQTQKEDVE